MENMQRNDRDVISFGERERGREVVIKVFSQRSAWTLDHIPITLFTLQ